MTTNITTPDSAQFIAGNFVSSAGVSVTPSSVVLNVTYFSGGTSVSTSIGMTVSGSFWTATWSSCNADLGNADWTVTTDIGPNPAQAGTLRIIDP